MAYNPGTPIVIKVEINAGVLGWVDVTARGRAASCVIQQGRTGGAIQAEPSRLQLTLGNPDGYLTEDNAVSPYYGSWGRGCEIRVSRIGLTVSPAERFHGQIDTIVERYPGGNVDATVEVTAVGTLGILTQGSDSLRSPLYRTMAGITAGDFLSIAYWPCEDGSASQQFASSFPAQPPAQIKGSVTPASYTGFPGSSAIPVLNSGGQIIARFPAYTNTGVWQAQFAFMIPNDMAVDKNLFEVTLIPDAFYARLMGSWDTATNMLRITAYSQDGAQVDSNVGGLGAALVPGTPYIGAITELPDTGDRFSFITVRDTAGNLAYQTMMVGSGGSVAGKPAQIRAIADSVSAGLVFGHLSLYTDPDLATISAIQPNALSAGGYVGELSGDRMVRLCREENVAFTLTGSAADTQPMGPQLIDTLVANLRNCETVDQGLMHDNGPDGAAGYVTLTHLYNQTATVAVVNGSLEPGLEAIRDNQYVHNDITSSRSDGGSAHVSDEAHIAKVRARLKDDRQPNVQADGQLLNDAGWAVHIGTAPGARYNAVGINLRNPDGALLADAVAAHAIGDRLTIARTALPPQHDIGGIDGLTVGWTELLDVDTWIFRPNLVPYSPYAVGVYGTARYDSAFTTTAEVLDTTETGVDIAVTAGTAGWPTTAAQPSQFPFEINIGGERMAVTANTSTGTGTYTMTVTRSVNGVVKSHATGVPVHIWQPAFYAY